jgi:glucokinase
MRDAAPCGCGGFGCLEQYASAYGIQRMARARMGERAPASSEELAHMASGGNAEAQSVFHAVGHYLAIGLTAVINMLNLPLVIIGGGVAEAWDLFAPRMFSELRRLSYVYLLTEPGHCVCDEASATRIEKASLGSSAGLLGACLLPFHTNGNLSHQQGVQVAH